MADIRAAIAAWRFEDFRRETWERWARGDLPPI
jgi:queuine/archaeosine tRNA-ribosyltransferase